MTPPAGTGFIEDQRRHDAAVGHPHAGRAHGDLLLREPDVADSPRQVRARAAPLPAAQPAAARHRSQGQAPGHPARHLDARSLRAARSRSGLRAPVTSSWTPSASASRTSTRSGAGERKTGTLDVAAAGEIFDTRPTSTASSTARVELGAKLAQSQQVRELHRDRVVPLRQRARRELDRARPHVHAAATGLKQTSRRPGHDMREIAVKIASSDAFRFRSTEGGGQ